MSDQRRPNVFEPEWHSDEEPGGFQRKRSFVGRDAGCERLGASVFELSPGRTSSPYHAHLASEELIVVLAGELTLRGPSGSRELAPGEVVALPVGDAGAHQVSNFGDQVGRYLIVSEMRSPDVILYPDSGKVGVYGFAPGPPRDGLREFHVRERGVEFLEGEVPPEV